VTIGDDDSLGVGELPKVLVEHNRELNGRGQAKKQSVVRVHFETDGSIRLVGFKNLIPKLQFKAKEFKRGLLGRRSALDYLRISGGKPAVLTIKLVYNPLWHVAYSVEERIKRLRNDYQNPGIWTFVNVGESEDACVERHMAEKYEDKSYGHFYIELAVDRLPNYSLCVNMAALIASTTWNGHWEILTCDCGSLGCAGMKRGLGVTHESGLTVWRLPEMKPRRLFVFDQQQYRIEIMKKMREALKIHEPLPADVHFGNIGFECGRAEQRKWVETELTEAERFFRNQIDEPQQS